MSVGELFPSDDVLARWMFMLSAVVDDLSVADRLVHDAVDAGRPDVTHHFRLIVVRLYEAGRLVAQVDAHPEVQALVDNVAAAAGPLASLRASYTPADGSSSINAAFGLIRVRSVHYSWVGSDELPEILDAGRDVVARMVVDHSDQSGSFDWPRSVFEAITWATCNCQPTQRKCVPMSPSHATRRSRS